MSTDPDDALRWEGDEPEAPAVPVAKTPPAAPAEAPAPAEGSATATSADAVSVEGDEEPAAIGNVALVFYGLIGGIYLLFAAGWVVGGLRLRPRASLLLGDWMYFPWMWLAALAPVLWFAASWVLTRGRASWIRIVALVAGAVLLVPWPFVMFGTVGA
ncbi:MAG: hypothetical protein JST25_12560 [Actinobacteria bacterium]|nr:hypothetical protein [Actinomycetota bacterium]